MLDQWRERLGPGLWELIAAMPERPVIVQQLTRQASNRDVRGSFRLTFADGTSLKGRRFDSPAKAEFARDLRSRLALPFLPRVLGQCGDAIIEQWIDGRVLAAQTVTLDEVREAGRLLRALHDSAPAAGELERGGLPPDVAGWAQRLREHLQLLVEAGAVEPERAEGIEQAAMSHLPPRLTLGIVHRDWCPENLVIDAAGRMHCIDTGTLTVGAIEEDMARLAYRWPMSDVQQAAFATGYGEGAGAGAGAGGGDGGGTARAGRVLGDGCGGRRGSVPPARCGGGGRPARLRAGADDRRLGMTTSTYDDSGGASRVPGWSDRRPKSGVFGSASRRRSSADTPPPRLLDSHEN